MRQREKQAERLFDAIGLIDDRIIAEAAAPFEKKKKIPATRAIGAFASALALTLVVFVGASFFLDNMVDGDMDKTEDMASDPTESALALSSTLMSLKSDTTILVMSYEEIEYFGDRTSIIWRYEGESEYRVEYISRVRAAELRSELEKSSKAANTLTDEQMPCEVWICYGDGTVVSPYLKLSEGNTGYRELFDYNPEIEPSEELVKLINDLISD